MYTVLFMIRRWIGFSRQSLAINFAGQVIEQFGMREGSFPLQSAEVAERRDKPAAQVMLPQAIDDHPREQVAGSVLAIRDPFGKRPTPI